MHHPSMLKFRPSLTIHQIEYLVNLLQTQPICEDSKNILASLHKFQLKATHGITAPSHVSTGRPSLDAQLGFSPDNTIESLLTIYESNPSILSTKQLERVQFHRFQNDLMSWEEEQSYLSTNIGESHG